MLFFNAMCAASGCCCSNGRQRAAGAAAESGKALPPLLPSAHAHGEVIGSFSTEEHLCL
jgi:hypothetical protein